jgi:hypothetical protein
MTTHSQYEELKRAAREAGEKYTQTQDKGDFAAWRKLVGEYHSAREGIMVERGLLLRNHTHPELVDPFLRRVLANELLVLRRARMDRDDERNIQVGLDTFARRIQDIQRHGLEAVYQQNFSSR